MLGVKTTCVKAITCIDPRCEAEFRYWMLRKMKGRSIEKKYISSDGKFIPDKDTVKKNNELLQRVLTTIDEEHYLILLATLTNYADIISYIAATKAYERSVVLTYKDFAKEVIVPVKLNGDYVDLFDMNYIILPIDVMQRIMNKSYLFAEKYLEDLFDCDDFAESFRSIVDNIFLCNSVGFAGGKLIDEDGNVVGLHAYNIVPAYDPNNGQIEVYIYEPQLSEYVPASNPIIDGLRYETMFAMFG